MKYKTTLIVLSVISCFLLLSLFINNKKDLFNNHEIAGFSTKITLLNNEKVVKVDTSLHILYNNCCMIENTTMFLNKVIQGNYYNVFISVTHEYPSVIIAGTNKKFRTASLRSKAFSKIIEISYTESENFVLRSIFKEKESANFLIVDIVSKDSILVNRMSFNKKYLTEHFANN